MFSIIPYNNRIVRRENNGYMNPFNDDFFRAFFGNPAAPSTFSVDVEDEGDHYLLKADLPGVEKENLKISIDDGLMTIEAKSDVSSEENHGNYVCRERRCGSMKRAFNLEGVAEEGITAQYKDGVLTMNLPKQAEVAPKAREIEIN
jgi:HSP20 family protein